MRRSDREITDIGTICEIIDRCKVLRLAMCVGNLPYVVPLNFGYTYADGQLEFYFHCAKDGKKMDILKQNNHVCVELDCDHELTTAPIPCGYGYNYRSVIAMGEVSFVTDLQEKIAGFRVLMKHQTDDDFVFTKEQVESITLGKITVREISGKMRM